MERDEYRIAKENVLKNKGKIVSCFDLMKGLYVYDSKYMLDAIDNLLNQGDIRIVSNNGLTQDRKYLVV